MNIPISWVLSGAHATRAVDAVVVTAVSSEGSLRLGPAHVRGSGPCSGTPDGSRVADFESGRWFGHENLGEVVEVGGGVDKVQVGVYVVLPFSIACGHCKNCDYCLTVQPDPKVRSRVRVRAHGPYGG